MRFFTVVLGISFCFTLTIKAQIQIKDIYGELVWADTNDEIFLTKYDSLEHDLFYFISIDDFQHIQLIRTKDGLTEGVLISSVWETNRKEEKLGRYLQYIEIPETKCLDMISFLSGISFNSLIDCNEGLVGKTVSISVCDRKGIFEKVFYGLDRDCNGGNNNLVKKKDINIVYEKLSNQFNMDLAFERFTEILPKGAYLYQSTYFIVF